ncbi:endopeptidase La [Candidatus Poribacteria bacterium]|nr:MAG: endopeptidase La [Candidatus Poribacteria bacterium]
MLVKKERSVPRRRNYLVLPVLGLREKVIFPRMRTPLIPTRPRDVNAVKYALLNDERILLLPQKENKEDPSPEDFIKVGTIARILESFDPGDGTIRIMIEGFARAEVKEIIAGEEFFQAKVVPVEEPGEKDNVTIALMKRAISMFETFAKKSKKVPAELLMYVYKEEHPGRLADLIAVNTTIKPDGLQKILEAIDPKERLQTLLVLLQTEIEILELEERIQEKVRKQMEKNQREYYLTEKLKAIKRELSGGKEETEIDELRRKIKEAKMPPEVEEKALKELERLEQMPPMSAETAVIRNYIDWLISLPWSVYTETKIDLEEAARILDEDHYGLEKVKERILEYLAVLKLVKKLRGPILCFVGPPGVGKSSLAKSIARATGRNFVRMSLGGVRDEAEIRGHRRTYVGALPGRIIQGIREAKSKNPVFLLDEVDKMSVDFRGDPAAALLEVLDPEQNSTFRDHYLDVEFDLSDVMFICTANYKHAIPPPLLDRMEVIEIPGYTEYEKHKIAKYFLIPKQLKAHGLDEKKVKITDQAIYRIIREYTREAGVRNLEREITSICRKVAKEIVRKGELDKPVKVTAKSIPKYLGVPKFSYNKANERDEVGVATGLVYTQVGGDIIAVEATTMKGEGKLVLTGQLGDVMQESAQTALSFIRSKASELGVPEEIDFKKIDIHIHVPEGAVPKEGPSAGITIATAILSALTSRPVRRDVAMTGEITLRGRILAIGGLKEKVLAAHRAGIKHIILPKDNEKDMVEIPPEIRKTLKFHFVERAEEAFRIALREPPLKAKEEPEKFDFIPVHRPTEGLIDTPQP